jgi:hypothetical protein
LKASIQTNTDKELLLLARISKTKTEIIKNVLMAAQVKRLLINNHENRMEKKNPKDTIWAESNTKIGKKKR